MINKIDLITYECESCGKLFTAPNVINEEVETNCPHCGEELLLSESTIDAVDESAKVISSAKLHAVANNFENVEIFSVLLTEDQILINFNNNSQVMLNIDGTWFYNR